MNNLPEIHGVKEGEWLSADEPDKPHYESFYSAWNEAHERARRHQADLNEQIRKAYESRKAAQREQQATDEVTLIQCAAFILFGLVAFLGVFHATVLANSGT